MERYAFSDKHEFLAKLDELVSSGIPKRTINTRTPYHMQEVEELLDHSQSSVRFFTAIGALSGLIAGFAFTIFTVLDWSLITGGKPLISIPPFLIISYELTILFGCLTAFVGFLHLARMPRVADIVSRKEEFSQKFEIIVGSEARR